MSINLKDPEEFNKNILQLRELIKIVKSNKYKIFL